MERSRPLVPIRESESSGVTYAEVRFWAVILRSFTVRDLADSMAVDESVAERGIIALLYHGIIVESASYQLSLWGDERIYEYVPLPPGPNEHETGTPPWMLWPCGSEVLSPRGEPVRIRTQRDQRGAMSTPGSRQKLKNRERAYQRQKEARERRAEEQREKAMNDPKWKVVRRGKRDHRLAHQSPYRDRLKAGHLSFIWGDTGSTPVPGLTINEVDSNDG